MSNQKPFILVDGSSYLFRAYHALPALTNSKGIPTGAVYGVINMLRKLFKDYDPTHCAVVFDPKGDTFRNEMYSEYKANRDAMPDELQVQIKPLFDIIKAMGLPLVIVDNVEADDVIGTLAVQASALGMNTVISTGDKDMAQLVNDQVILINTMSNTTMDPQGVEEKFGIPPELIIDYLTLIGDTVDNVPGVPKVGPKTAVKWLTQYGNLDNIIEHADEFPGKVGENLRAALKDLPLSKALVTIKLDVAMDKGPNDLSPRNPDNEKLKELYKEMEFKAWLSALLDNNATEDKPTKRYRTITTEKTFQIWMEKVSKAELVAFDAETTSLDYMEAQLVGVSMAIEGETAVYIPVAHDYAGAPEQLSRDYVLKALQPFLEDEKQLKVGQNLKYDKNVFANYHIELKGIAFDTMLESYVLDSTASRHNMDSMALKYLGYKTITFEEVAGKGVKQLTFNEVALEQATPYAAEDADITLQLHQHLWPRLSKIDGLKNTFETIEMPLLPILSRMERTGVLLDAKALKKQSISLAKRIAEIEEEAHTVAGEAFNLGSPKQLQGILFEKLQIPVLQKTPKGQPSTAESALQDLAQDYELPNLILEYRSLSKLKSTYTDKLPLQINARTGRVHTSYHQAVAATGRLSSSDPNLQNIPIRTEQGRQIRQAFIAPEGYKIVALDYSQIELRIMAHLSKDEGLIKAFEQGLDIHRATSAEVFDIPLEEVTTDQRRSAKAINFGLIYGMSAFGLAKQLGVDRKEAQAYVDLYFHRYPGVKRYMEETRATAHEQGFVETLYGRRLYLPEINARNKQRQMAAERTAINAPMQGTAADIIKRAMIKVDAWLQDKPVDANMIMQVHDELVFEVAEVDLERTIQQVEQFMTETGHLSVPVLVDTGIGDNWDEAH